MLFSVQRIRFTAAGLVVPGTERPINATRWPSLLWRLRLHGAHWCRPMVLLLSETLSVQVCNLQCFLFETACWSSCFLRRLALGMVAPCDFVCAPALALIIFMNGVLGCQTACTRISRSVFPQHLLGICRARCKHFRSALAMSMPHSRSNARALSLRELCQQCVVVSYCFASLLGVQRAVWPQIVLVCRTIAALDLALLPVVCILLELCLIRCGSVPPALQLTPALGGAAPHGSCTDSVPCRVAAKPRCMLVTDRSGRPMRCFVSRNVALQNRREL